MNYYENLLRPLLFQLDPETAHNLVRRVGGTVQYIAPLLKFISWLYETTDKPQPVRVAGIDFPNWVGLAAGFDKNAEMILPLQATGFGFLEVGTVLPRPQPGNPRPRMFRLPKHEALVNRMGFNSDGALVVRRNLEKVWSQVRVPIGVSVSKNLDTPLEETAEDMVKSIQATWWCSDFFVLGVSSPNTTRLRELQQKEYLAGLVSNVVQTEKRIARDRGKSKPIFVKLAPDMTGVETIDAYEASMLGGASGFVLANTSVNANLKANLGTDEEGGVSGPPIHDRARKLVRLVRDLDKDVPIIFSGGINSPEAAIRARDDGADAIQIYTGFIYHGAPLVQTLRQVAPRQYIV